MNHNGYSVRSLPEIARLGVASHDPPLIIEVMPPKTPAGWDRLLALVRTVHGEWRPAFFSMADTGSDRDASIEAAIRLRRETDARVMAHLACRGRSRDDVNRHLRLLQDAGIDHLLIVRGDADRVGAPFVPHRHGFAHANELMAYVREHGGSSFVLGGVTHPDGHSEDACAHAARETVRRKVAAGARFFVTQAVFAAEVYDEHARFLHQACDGVPLIPGFFAVQDPVALKDKATRCGLRLPPAFTDPTPLATSSAFDRLLDEARLAWIYGRGVPLSISSFNDLSSTSAFLRRLLRPGR